mgnify:CR=1 FL=1
MLLLEQGDLLRPLSELALDNLKKIEIPYNAFIAKADAYLQRTGDPRAIRSIPRRCGWSATTIASFTRIS